MLACRQKTNFVGKYRSVPLAGSCSNFYPSGIFKEGPEAIRRIPLTRGKFAIVDADDYYRLAEFRWQAVSGFNTIYASGSVAGKTVNMHRWIMDAPDHLVVDHIDHNGLNNCKANLRLCTTAQNIRNSLSIKGATSKYKGVSWDKIRRKWHVGVRLNNKRHYVGYFTDEIAAAKAYDEKAKVLHREFACLNFP